MAERLIIFREGTTELVLPVTPPSYQVECGNNVEQINIHELGDVVLTGHSILATIRMSCLFPYRAYRFAMDDDPDYYVDTFKRWVGEKSRLRFIVSDTGINLPVVVEHFSYGERDGTNDVYADLTLREYRELRPVQVSTTQEARTAPQTGSSIPPYTVKPGDTLSALCRKFYGDGSQAVWSKVAAHNGITNPHLIYVGQTINFPTPLS